MPPTAERAPIVLAVSGASAQPLAQRALQLLLQADEQVELVVSRGAIGVWQAELGIRVPSEPESQQEFWRERTGCHSGGLRCHRWNDQAAAIASGSHRTRGMVICPRETPWNLVHLRNLTALAEAGARIAPPVPAWYHRPSSLEEMVDFLVIRVFDCLGYDLGDLQRWSGPLQT